MLSWGGLLLVSTLAVLMVSNVRYASFKNVGLSSNKPFVTLPILTVLVAGIWFYSRWVLLALALGYVLHGPLLKFWNLMGRMRSRAAAGEEGRTSASFER